MDVYKVYGMYTSCAVWRACVQYDESWCNVDATPVVWFVIMWSGFPGGLGRVELMISVRYLSSNRGDM